MGAARETTYSNTSITQASRLPAISVISVAKSLFHRVFQQVVAQTSRTRASESVDQLHGAEWSLVKRLEAAD